MTFKTSENRTSSIVNMKSEIEYKLPKRMKKRRELDALVDTGKLPRSRKNSSSAQELLDYHSDSSDIDEYTTNGAKRKNRCCVCQSLVARISLFLICLACLSTCVGLVWVQWHIRHELNILRSQVQTVQVSNTATPDTISKLETRVEKLDKTLADIRAGSLEELLKNTTDLKAKIDALEKANKEILASVSSSKQYMDLPIKFKDLTDTVAKIGSDTSHQSLSVEALDKRVAQLEAKSSNPTNPVNSVADEAASLRQELKEILDAQVANITQDLAQHLTRILSLEAVTRSLMGQNDSAVNVNEMYLLRGEFLAFKKDEHDNFKKSNASLYILNEDLDKLVARAERIENVIYNLTAAVEKFKNPGSAPSISTLSPILVSPSNTATTDGPIANGTEDKVGSPAQDDGHTMR